MVSKKISGILALPPVGGDQKMLLIMSILIGFLIVDTMLNTVADILSHQLASNWGVALFIMVAVVYGLGQYFILEFVKQKSREVRNKQVFLRISQPLVTTVQYFLTAILVFVILEIILTSHYYNLTLVLVTIASMSVNVVLMGLFALKFFTWYKTNRTSVTVLLYAISFVAFALTSGIALLMDTYNLLGKQGEITVQSKVVFPSFQPGTVTYLPHELYHYSDLVSFVLIWAGTALLLRAYSNRIGRLKFWVILSLPLLYYMSTLIDFFNLYAPASDLQYLYLYLFLSMNSTAGGILFGIAFRIVARTIPAGSIVKDYMTIAAYGLILLFISDQVTLTDSAYPPFGFATMCVTGLSAYLLLVGLYSSAISISQDSKLRYAIRKSMIEESKFLDGVGSAQMEQDICKKTLLIAKEHSDKMISESGVQTSLTDDQIKQYLQDVIDEVRRKPRQE